MSAIYRFGFEHAFVPSGVTTYGDYLYIGREGNCSLYGNWPRVECELEPTNKIRGSFAALSYAHNLNDIKNQYHVDFGPVRLKQHISGHISIELSGQRVASVGGFDAKRGYWYPIQFLIEPGRVEFIYDSYPLIYEGNFNFENQSVIKIAGLGATGSLEDISLNTATGLYDTGVPTLFAGLPSFYTGAIINNFSYSQLNTLDTGLARVSGYDTRVYNSFSVDQGAITSTSYCPANNCLYILGNTFSGNSFRKYDFNKNQFVNFLNIDDRFWTGQNSFFYNNNFRALEYCPSRNTNFIITGGTNSRAVLLELDLNDNILNRVMNYSPASSLPNDNTSSLYYNANSNNLFIGTISSTNTIYKIDSNTLEFNAIDIDNVTHIVVPKFNDYAYFKISNTLYKINVHDDSYTPLVLPSGYVFLGISSPYVYTILPEFGSGIGVFQITGKVKLSMFNLDRPEIIDFFNLETSQINQVHMSYSKLSKNIFFNERIYNSTFATNKERIYSIDLKTNNYNIILYNPNGALDYSSWNYAANPYVNYCDYNNMTYFPVWTYIGGRAPHYIRTLSHHQKDLINFLGDQNHNQISFKDSYNYKTSYDDANSLLYQNKTDHTGFEGFNIKSNFRKERKNPSSLSIGVLSGNNLDILGTTQNRLGGNTEKSYSILYKNGGKITDSGALDFNIYMRYDRNLGFLDGE